MVAAERLHGCVVDHTHRQSECFGKIETNPTFAQMLRISCNPSVAHRHGKTNGCPVEFPTAHVLFKSCHKLFWPHSLPGRKFALIARRHQQFYVCAADIDDQNLSLHERAAAPNASGKLPVASHGSAKTLEKALLFWFCRSAGMPAFHYFESEKPE